LAICLMEAKSFTSGDFKRFHPGGSLGQRLSLKVADIMHSTGIPLALESDSLKKALEVLDKGSFGALALTDAQGRLTGILTDGDVRRIVCRGKVDMNAPVARVMTARPRSVSTDMSAAELMDIMEQMAITVLPVISEQGTVAGLVHIHDLLGKGQIRFASNSPA